jgi:hypothetical protein
VETTDALIDVVVTRLAAVCLRSRRQSIRRPPGEPAKVRRVADTPGDDFGWWLDSLSPSAGYVAAIASQT